MYQRYKAVPRIAALIIALTACSSASQARPGAAAERSADDSAVIDAAQRLFDAMEAKDTVALQALLHPQAQIIALSPSGRVIGSGRDAWIRSIAAATEPLRERMWDPRVEIEGDLATLWAPYDFHVGERFSHCGVDAFQFVRDGTTWRMLVVTYTRRTEGCSNPRP